MKRFKVTFYPDARQIEVGRGENLLEAALAADIHINTSCGGEGTCGRCRVLIDEGTVALGPAHKLTDEEAAKGYVLACQAEVASDLKVLIPPETRLGSVPEAREEVVMVGRALSAAEEAERLDAVTLDPPVVKLFVALDPPTLDDNASDASRLTRSLRRAGVTGDLTIDYEVLKALAATLRAADWQVTATLLNTSLRVPHPASRVVKVEPGDTTGEQYALAVDVGTTTIVAKLVDMTTKQAVAETSGYNAQISCGEDVISRIVFAGKGRGLQRLQGLVVDTINDLAIRLLEQTGIGADSITLVTAAGNTIMLHLLLGMDPKYLREEPYVPTTSTFPFIRAAGIGLKLDPAVRLFPLPCVASYLGADVVAGVVAAGMEHEERLTLYIDIGTNGEMVLGNSDFLVSCSCSAGPAFEGGGVKFGMRATAGAIEEVAIDRETFEPSVIAIGGKRPVGICGSGLIDLLAGLFLAGVVDRKGKIHLDIATPRVRTGDGGPEYVLVWERDAGGDTDIVITEVDIDNLMRAKAAVFAAITVLLDSIDTPVDALERVLIAGAFGKHLDARKAMLIGLLPELPDDKFVFIGNGSLWGAHMSSLSRSTIAEVQSTAKRMTYLDLSTNNKFMDGYVAALFLPHTNPVLFPSAIRELEQE